MRTTVFTIVALLVGLVYGVVRYIVFGGVDLDQFPVYVVNKAVSITGLLLIAVAVGARPLSGALPKLGWLLAERRPLGMAGLGFSGLHVVLSLMLLGPGYFGKFYDAQDGMMKASAEWSMLAGAVALSLLVWQSRINGGAGGASEASARRRWLGTGVLALSLLHVTFMGWPGWLRPDTWPGGMPPITLLSAAVALVGLLLALVPRRA